MQALTDRPPYVAFEMRAIEDRNASLAAGHFVAKDVPYVIVTPAGSKDRYENIADNWFQTIRNEVKAGRFPPAWLEVFEKRFEAWKRQEEAPINGHSLKSWPVLSPAQLRTCQSAHLMTIEDLAAANEETILRLGMGGRQLKQKAVDWLRTANDTGKVAEELNSLRAENQTLQNEIARLQEDVAHLRNLAKSGASAPVQPSPVDQEFEAVLGVKL